MLSNEEENVRARYQKNKLWASGIEEGDRPSVQKNYEVQYSNVVEPTTGGGRRLNVNKPNIRGRGEQSE